MTYARRPFLFLSFLIALGVMLGTCGPANRQDIDLSDELIDDPVDGVGHYVYAINLSVTVAPGEKFEAQMEWRTVGSVDPNARYTMDIILKGPQEKVWSIPPGANTVGELHLANWLSYPFTIPENFSTGTYAFGVRLRDELKDGQQVGMAFKESRAMGDGFYRLGDIEVAAP